MVLTTVEKPPELTDEQINLPDAQYKRCLHRLERDKNIYRDYLQELKHWESLEGLFLENVDGHEYLKIKECKSGGQMWDVLKASWDDQSITQLESYQHELEHLKYTNLNDDISFHLSSIKNLIQKIKNCDHTAMSNKQHLLKICNSFQLENDQDSGLHTMLAMMKNVINDDEVDQKIKDHEQILKGLWQNYVTQKDKRERNNLEVQLNYTAKDFKRVVKEKKRSFSPGHQFQCNLHQTDSHHYKNCYTQQTGQKFSKDRKQNNRGQQKPSENNRGYQSTRNNYRDYRQRSPSQNKYSRSNQNNYNQRPRSQSRSFERNEFRGRSPEPRVYNFESYNDKDEDYNDNRRSYNHSRAESSDCTSVMSEPFDPTLPDNRPPSDIGDIRVSLGLGDSDEDEQLTDDCCNVHARVYTFHQQNLNEICLDTGSAIHVTNNLSLLRDQIEIKGKNIIVGNGNSILCTIKGTLDIMSRGLNNMLSINNVYYNKSFNCTIVSISELKGFQQNTDDYHCYIKKNGEVIVRGDLKNGLFLIDNIARSFTSNPKTFLFFNLQAEDQDENKNSSKRPAEDQNLKKIKSTQMFNKIRHQQMGHFYDINNKKKNIQGLHICNESTCANCDLAKKKNTWKKRPFTPIETEGPMHILAIDLCGPFPVTSKQGSRYWLIVVDD